MQNLHSKSSHFLRKGCRATYVFAFLVACLGGRLRVSVYRVPHCASAKNRSTSYSRFYPSKAELMQLSTHEVYKRHMQNESACVFCTASTVAKFSVSAKQLRCGLLRRRRQVNQCMICCMIINNLRCTAAFTMGVHTDTRKCLDTVAMHISLTHFLAIMSGWCCCTSELKSRKVVL